MADAGHARSRCQDLGGSPMNLKTAGWANTRKVTRKARVFGFLAILLSAAHLPGAALAHDEIDRVTGFARDPVHVTAWPGGKKVAVTFAHFVEVFGFGQGPVFRPDLMARNPDLVNEAFRQYAIT